MSGSGRSAVRTIGIVLAVIFGILGLMVVGIFILFFIAMSNYGSNK
jgi:hypothetical protein